MMRVKKLLHTRMRVSDMDQTIRFYQDVLGLEVLERKVSPRGSPRLPESPQQRRTHRTVQLSCERPC